MATNSTPDTATLIANTIANNKANPLYGNQALTPQQLQPVSPIRTVPVGDTTSGLAGITASASDQVIGDLGNVQNQIATREKNAEQLGGDKAFLTQLLGNQPLDLVNEQANQGVNEETANFNKLQEQLLGLNAQASGLNREAQAIPLITQQNLTAQGRIASEGGIAPENSAALRNNAIKALSIAAQSDIALAAAQGSEIRLNAAKDKAKQIVDIRYAQIEAELKAKQLQYDLNKDVLTRLDAKRTEALGVALKKEERELLAEKELATYKAEATTTALAAGAPKSVIDAAGNAKTSLEVAQILGKYSPETLKYELLKEQIKTEKAQRANYNASAAKTRKETDQIGAAVVGLDGLISTLPKSSQERYYKLQGDFDAATKNYRGAIDSANSITALSKDSTPQQQTAMIFQYMKTLDPSSTVREGEFALVGKTAGLSDRAVNALRKLDNGSRLNEAQIADIVGAAQVLSRNAKQNLDLTSAEYDRRAAKFGLPTGLFYEPQEVQQDVVDNKFSQGLGGSIQSFNTQGLSVTNSGDLDWQLPSNEPVKTNQFISGNKAKLK